MFLNKYINNKWVKRRQQHVSQQASKALIYTSRGIIFLMTISIHKTLTVMKLTVWFWWFLTIIPSIDCTSCCEYSARNFRKSFHNVQYPMYNFICYFGLFTRVKCVHSLLGLVASHVRKGSCLSALFFGLPTWQSCNTMHVFLILWFSFILYFRWWEIGGQCLQWNSVSKYFNSPRSEAPLPDLLFHEQIMCSTLLRWNKQAVSHEWDPQNV